MIEFFVPGNPQALKRHRTFRRGKFIGQYDPSAGDKMDFLAKCMQYKPEKPLESVLSLGLLFCFDRPKSVSAKKRPFHITRPDLDNLVKFVLDSLNGIFWKDDAQIAAIDAHKIYNDTIGIAVKIQEGFLNDKS